MGTELRILKNLIQVETERAELLEQEVRRKNYGNLYIKKRGRNVCFAEYRDGKQKWITRDKERVYAVARYQYARRQLASIRQIRKILMDARAKIDETVSDCNDSGFLKKYSMLEPNRITMSPREKDWLTKYNSNPYRPEALRYCTTGGIKMRSKSERTIGNKLEEYNIPYRYEPRLMIENKTYYPDFMILCSNGSIVIWEHFGMMDQEEYRMHALLKTIQYRKIGFKQINNLICTWEEDLDDLETVDEIIETYIINPPKRKNY